MFAIPNQFSIYKDSAYFVTTNNCWQLSVLLLQGSLTNSA